MRTSVLAIKYRCRLITLLLILLEIYVVDAYRVSGHHQPNFGLHNSTFLSDPNQPSVLRRYFFESRCSEMYVRIKLGTRNSIDASGREPGANYTSIIMESIGMNGRVRLQGEMSKHYLCFSKKGKLRARHDPKTETCNFIYNITSDGYYQFRLEANEQWFIGFKKKKLRNSVRGKALPGYKKRGLRFEGCYDFKLKPVDLPKRATTYSPIDFAQLPKDWDPEKPVHKLRPMKHLRQNIHRKTLRRRNNKNINRKSKMQKTPGS